MEKIYLVKNESTIFGAYKSYEKASLCAFDLTSFWHSKFKTACPDFKIVTVWIND